MEASMNVGIRPIERPQSPGAGEGVGRRGDGGGSSAAFSPKTNVAIQNAVDDMAGILSKIASNQTDAVEKMPADLQKLIQNVMKQAFSLEETLAQGLGSTLESQRFSMEQLSAFSRMLTQMGKLMDRGMTMEVSDTMQALLTNLKNMASTEQGAALEPVLLTKAAFGLLDNKPFAELPKEIQQLLLTLQPQGMVQPMPTGEGNSLQFLKQLVEYFMPRPASAAEGGNAPQGQPAMSQTVMQNGQLMSQGQTGQPNMMNTNLTGQQGLGNVQSTIAGPQGAAMPQTVQAGAATQVAGQPLPEGNFQPAQGQNALAQSGTGNMQQSAVQGQQSVAPQQSMQAGAASQVSGQPVLEGATQNVSGQNLTSQSGAGNMQTAASGAQGIALPQQQAGAGPQLAGQAVQAGVSRSVPAQNQNSQQAAGNMQDTRQTANSGQYTVAGNESAEAGAQARPQQAAMQQAKNQLLNQVMENTPQTMNALRDLAQLLLKDGNLTQKDALLMQSFVNGKEALLNAKEAQQLQQLIRLCQANVPATVQQAALQQNIPDLPRLWAFMQLCDMAYARNMTSRQLKKAGRDVAAFVLSMRNSMEGDNSIVPGQRSLNFMLPMYMGEESTYPAYIHVYDEKQPDPETGEMKKETWLRLCVLTDNIGAVELTCRVYQENQLDMRLFFSSTETANEFRAESDALRTSLKDSKLKLKDLKISAVGERRFM